MTSVCGGREGGGEKAAASPLLFPSIYNSTQSHSEHSEESPPPLQLSDNKVILGKPSGKPSGENPFLNEPSGRAERCTLW